MKKALFLLLSLVILVLLFVGCTNESNTKLDIARAYVYRESAEVMKPTIVLEENNRFIFTFSALSSYLPAGSCEVNSEYLFLKTDDEEYEYVFKMKGDTLIFDAEKSSALPSFTDIPDGAVFE